MKVFSIMRVGWERRFHFSHARSVDTSADTAGKSAPATCRWTIAPELACGADASSVASGVIGTHVFIGIGEKPSLKVDRNADLQPWRVTLPQARFQNFVL